MSAMFLEDTELFQLTRLKRYSAQARWLQRNGIRHVIGADGSPRVLRSAVERILGGSTAPKSTQPDVDALNNLYG